MYFLFNFWKATNSGNKFFFFFFKQETSFLAVYDCLLKKRKRKKKQVFENTFFLNIFCFATLCLMHYDEEMK